MKFYFRFMLVFQGVEAESIEGFIKTKLQPKLKDAEFIIQRSFLLLIYLFQDDACFKFGGVIFFYFQIGSEIFNTQFLEFLVFLL